MDESSEDRVAITDSVLKELFVPIRLESQQVVELSSGYPDIGAYEVGHPPAGSVDGEDLKIFAAPLPGYGNGDYLQYISWLHRLYKPGSKLQADHEDQLPTEWSEIEQRVREIANGGDDYRYLIQFTHPDTNEAHVVGYGGFVLQKQDMQKSSLDDLGAFFTLPVLADNWRDAKIALPVARKLMELARMEAKVTRLVTATKVGNAEEREIVQNLGFTPMERIHDDDDNSVEWWHIDFEKSGSTVLVVARPTAITVQGNPQ